MHLSFVIPTYNRAALLGQTIPALMSQQVDDDLTYEVIFVCNGATDHSEQVLKEAAEKYPGRLRYFYIAPTGGPSAPRNVGIREARGEIVIIQDDDVLPEPGMVKAHADFHTRNPDRRFAAIGEVYVPEHLLDDPMSLFHTFPYEEVRGREKLDYLFFWTCNVSFKRDFMLECGMFDEAFLYYEDMLCAYKLAQHGLELRFVPEARGQHLHRLLPSGVANKGLFTGRWLYPFVECVPERTVKERFGILSPEIGYALLARRLLKRAAFRIVDNPLTYGVLRAMGATRRKRGRITDAYYFLIFRKNLLAGYYEARRKARAVKAAAPVDAVSEWADRGEP